MNPNTTKQNEKDILVDKALEEVTAMVLAMTSDEELSEERIKYIMSIIFGNRGRLDDSNMTRDQVFKEFTSTATYSKILVISKLYEKLITPLPFGEVVNLSLALEAGDIKFEREDDQESLIRLLADAYSASTTTLDKTPDHKSIISHKGNR